MKRNFILLASVVIGAAVGGRVTAAPAAGNSYLGPITSRNLFQLKSSEPPSVVDPIPPSLPNIRLAGVTAIFGKKLAILRVPRPARPSEMSVMLSEGAPAEAGVQVLEINFRAGTARIMNGNTEQLLDMAANTLK